MCLSFSFGAGTTCIPGFVVGIVEIIYHQHFVNAIFKRISLNPGILRRKTQDTPATVEERQVKAVSLRCLLSDAAQAKP